MVGKFEKAIPSFLKCSKTKILVRIWSFCFHVHCTTGSKLTYTRASIWEARHIHMCLFSLLFAFFVSIYYCCCFLFRGSSSSLYFLLLIFFLSTSSFLLLMQYFVLYIYIVDYTVYDMRTVDWGASNMKWKDRTREKERKKERRETERNISVVVGVTVASVYHRVRKSSFMFVSKEFWPRILTNLFAKKLENQTNFRSVFLLCSVKFISELSNWIESKCTPLHFTVFFIFAVALYACFLIFLGCVCVLLSAYAIVTLLFME